MLDSKISYRFIKQKDNPFIAKIIRDALEEYGENKPGTVYTDPTTDKLYELFQKPKSIYYVAENKGHIIGGCGIFPTEGLPDGYAELVKLYVKKEYRKKGVGKKLMEISINEAEKMGYKNLYLESIPALNDAVSLYEKLGFVKINERLGDSGHFSCNLWMVKQVKKDYR